MKTQISLGIHSVWSESSLYVHWVAKGPRLIMWTEKTDQTGQMPKLIWIFAGCTGHFVGFVMMWLKQTNYVTVATNYVGIIFPKTWPCFNVGCCWFNSLFETVYLNKSWISLFNTPPTNHSHAKPRSIKNVHKRSFWFSIRGVKIAHLL